jgi:hypothetical protein
MRLATLVVAALLLAFPAAAKDKKDKDKDDDVEAAPEPTVDEDAFKEAPSEDEKQAPKRLEEGDKEETDDGGELDFTDEDQGPAVKFTDDDEQKSVAARGPGEDTAQLYRVQQKACAEMTPDEETIAWEEYLRKYPSSLFKDRIDARMEELSTLLFSERVPGSDRGARALDAAKRELNFATPARFLGVDPRSKIRFGFEWGFPAWFGLTADLEYEIVRELSVHGGAGAKGKSGYAAVGGRYALIKSARTGTVLSGSLDFEAPTNPFYLIVEPSVGFGQRVRFMNGLDLQVSLGPDLELRDSSDIVWHANGHAELRANDIVYIFAETSTATKYLLDEDDPATTVKESVDTFRFYAVTFGMRFVPRQGKGDNKSGRVVTTVGATTPYSVNYWGFYRGAVVANGDWYL